MELSSPRRELVLGETSRRRTNATVKRFLCTLEPSGCLYCASENDGEPRCGDAIAGEGKALRMVELKVSVGG